MTTRFESRLTLVLLLCAFAPRLASSQGRDSTPPTPTLGLDRGIDAFTTPALKLGLVHASQTVASLRPVSMDSIDFTPADWLPRRAADRFYHLGDLTLQYRTQGATAWRAVSTADRRRPVAPLPPSGATVLAAADLAPTLPPGLPLAIRRYWERMPPDGRLVLRFELTNTSSAPVDLGALGIPLIFNNVLTDRSLDQAHAVSSFTDPYIGGDAGYVQVTRLTGTGPVLLVVPHGRTPLEAWNPLLADRTRRGITFEGFYEWEALSQAFADSAWRNAEPWNPPTMATLAPGEQRSYGVEFLVSPSLRDIDETLLAAARPVAVGVPGYVLPEDVDGRLWLKHRADIQDIEVEPRGAVAVTRIGTSTPDGWQPFRVRGLRWGRARITLRYTDGVTQTVHYKVIKPAAQVAADLGHFLTTRQWYENPSDPFGRSPSVISYDNEAGRQVTEDNRAWIAGLGDEGGSGSWLAAIMKQLVAPDPAELAKLQRFVDGVLWGGLQYATGPARYGVRKSMFFYQPDSMPAGTYSDSIRYGGWASWSRQHAMTVGRSYDYPHVAAAYWVLYRLARNHEGLVTNHPWSWYLERAHETSEAMVRYAAHYAQFGQMEGTIFVLILQDLKREGAEWAGRASALEAIMRKRVDVWRGLGYPFGSEMPWDSTGQEEVYAWCRYFGFDDKALVTLNAILGYMPTVPHWGYNGSARRYWDFQYAGKTRRLERQLHHYGSGLNAIPVLSEYRLHPDDFYLLRVGYGGVLGSIANVTEEGFGPSGFHAYPSTLRIDGYSGDYGPGFFGHTINTGTYLVKHPEFGWLAFGGNVTTAGNAVAVRPVDASRSRVFVAPLGLWVTLDAGTIDEVVLEGSRVRVRLAPATAHTPVARLRLEQPSAGPGIGSIRPAGTYEMERGAYVVPLGRGATEVVLH